MKSVGIKENTHKNLKQLTQRYSLEMGEFVELSVDYFRKTQINPKDEILSYTDQLKKVYKEVNRVIGFIKTQEQEMLLPIMEEIRHNILLVEKYIETSNFEALESNIYSISKIVGDVDVSIKSLLYKQFDGLNQQLDKILRKIEIEKEFKKKILVRISILIGIVSLTFIMNIILIFI